MTIVDIIRDFALSLVSFDQAHPLLFTQFYFWAFFALVFAAFSLFHSKVLLRNGFLFAVSLFFYYKTSGVFLALLVFVIVYNYFAAKWLHRLKKEGWRSAITALSVVIDLGVLAYFKYAYFITDFVNNLFGLSIEVHDVLGEFLNALTGTSVFRVDAIILPVGISFFTFQAVSYIVDVKRRKIAPVRNFLDFGFYLSFFPQLVAGPIVRAVEFVEQLHKPYNLSRRWFGIAIFWIMNGLLKKLILADYMAVNFADRVFENPLLYSGFENLAALFCYSLQVYADFSGYTDIATGVAMLMGFYLPKNFNSPYKAPNTQDFWRRWHMTLSRWLRDYLYIPLGGNRNASAGTYIIIVAIAVIGSFLSGSWWVAAAVFALAAGIGIWAWLKPGDRKLITTNINSMNTMLLGGLWHGASWNFMIWGGLNGIGMVIYKIWTKRSMGVKMLIISLVTVLCGTLSLTLHYPVWNLFFVWTLIIWLGTLVRFLYCLRFSPSLRSVGMTEAVAPGVSSSVIPRTTTVIPSEASVSHAIKWLSNAWAIFQTFVFITFTRLFFRSGSNLDPALANEQAWNTAKNMVNQIGSHWDLHLLPAMIHQHRAVLILFVAGMLIHWLPERFKRRYRLTFSALPLPVMALVVVLIIVFFYQFITADLQSFIYFQF
ncbi:MAG: MBOAT family protein [Bacteroidales bacterium]|nr:MBOAT family protein [Bacteroidales bacterium]